MIIVNPKFLKIATGGFARGMALYPFIIVSDKKYLDDDTFINHEKIHWQQQKEMLLLFFYIWYILEYLYRRIQYKDRRTAYMNISFEREAYANECENDYLKQRKTWAFRHYLFS